METPYQAAIGVLCRRGTVRIEELRGLILPLCSGERECVETINRLSDSTAVVRQDGKFRMR